MQWFYGILYNYLFRYIYVYNNNRSPGMVLWYLDGRTLGCVYIKNSLRKNNKRRYKKILAQIICLKKTEMMNVSLRLNLYTKL